MQTDEQQIRDLIERWAAAVHAGDLAAVLDAHADDIVMFDVPPPHHGVRGLAAYRETWPPFFTWQAQGARFEITSLEVTAGADVAFAYALLRCGTDDDLDGNPEARLRLTLGLRRQDGRWVVAHEHHSFADTSAEDRADAEREIRDVHDGWSERTAAGDLDGLMATIAADVVSYEHETPLAYVGADDVREVCRRGLEAADGAVDLAVPGLRVEVRDDLAVAWGLNRVRAEVAGRGTVETWSRATRVFRRTGGRWEMTHQHLSFPMDPATGRAATDLRP
jgi:uncharacterized protein (TIGR02246 family)